MAAVEINHYTGREKGEAWEAVCDGQTGVGSTPARALSALAKELEPDQEQEDA